MRKVALGILSLSLALPCAGGEAKTINQVPFVSGQWTVPKITRTYTVQSDSIHRNLFYSLGGAGSFLYEDNRGPLNVLVFVDQGWNRILLTVEGEVIKAFGTSASGQDQLLIPSSLDVGAIVGDRDLPPIGNIFVADTGNNRVIGYSFSGRKFDLNGRMTQDDKLVQEFIIQGGTNFAQPVQVVWEDGGTPAVKTDDYLWVLDRWGARVAGYHITYNGSQYVASPYIYLDLRNCGLCNFPIDPQTVTKGRAYQTPDEFGSYNTTDLYVYDSANDQFLIYTIQRDPGFITAAMQATMVSVRAAPNPYPGSQYSYMTADAWGNICAIDKTQSRICKLSSDLTSLDTYGQSGSGPLGSEDMLDPVALSFQKVDGSGTPEQFTSRAILTERWGDQTGIQQLRMGITARSLTAGMRSGVDSVDISYFITDHGRTTIQILNSSGVPIRTMLSNVVERSGSHTLVWNGRNDAGVLVTKCSTYSAKIRAISLYAVPETSTVTAAFYYKPRALKTFTINSNVPGTQLTFDGQTTTLPGNTYAAACSVCTTHTVQVPGVQTLSGTRYCFQSWTGTSNRVHSVQVQRDTTLQLTLTTGSPPDTFPDFATVPDGLYPCNSPYVFLGDAKTTTSGLTVFPNTTLRFKIIPQVAKFKVRGPFSAREARFETTDSTSNNNTGKWSGIIADTVNVGPGGDGGNVSIALSNCTIRNADIGVSTARGASVTEFQRAIRTLTIDSCTFSTNFRDIRVRFRPNATSVLRLYRSRFMASSPIWIWGSATGDPTVPCTIENDTLTGLPLSIMLLLQGGMSGTVNNNYFRGAESNTTTLSLGAYLGTSGPFPSVTVTGNKFNCTAINNRNAIVAPNAPSGTTVSAFYNDWGVYDVSSINTLVWDKANDPALAEVLYNPFTVPPGGGCCGGGCPYVLSQSDTGFVVENTVLGASELNPGPASFVEDAYPLTSARLNAEGHVTVRIAELEDETDWLDYVGLVAVKPEDGEELGVTPEGRLVAFRPIPDLLTKIVWTGRNEPYSSPIAPGLAYSGVVGDSLEFTAPAGTAYGRRGIGIHMIPKPHAPKRPGLPIGVSIRISPDPRGNRWTSLKPLVPRERWSTAILPLGDLGTAEVSRIRVVWHSTHVLGSLFVADIRELSALKPLPLVSAGHSAGRSLSTETAQRDGKTIILRPGEYADFTFDAAGAPENTRFVLLARGRYELARSAKIPVAYGATRNRPNPFNPETSFDLELPRPSRVTVTVYDVAGRLVRTLLQTTLLAGIHTIRWDGNDGRGRPAASGVYFYQIDAETFSKRDRMVLLR